MAEPKIVKLRGSRRYLEWMRAHSGMVRITGVQSSDQRGMFSMGERDYTVTYLPVDAASAAEE